MAIGERIHFFRTLRGMTQKYLGTSIGFSESQSDVRIAQYETGKRNPKEAYLNALADKLGVAPEALNVPDIDTYVGLMHTLFALEDIYGLKIDDLDGEICLRLDRHSKSYSQMFDLFYSWNRTAGKLRRGEITKDEYDEWRYHYPNHETERFRKEVLALREAKAAKESK